MTVLKYRDALNQALFEEMRRDPEVFCLGEGIGDKGGSYKVTKGVTQLAGMAASGPAAPFTMAAQGFAAGREDYLNSMGVSDSEATQDRQYSQILRRI